MSKNAFALSFALLHEQASHGRFRVDDAIEWRARQDSNLRPTAPEAVALSN
jgi:hypothetical protein